MAINQDENININITINGSEQISDAKNRLETLQKSMRDVVATGDTASKEFSEMENEVKSLSDTLASLDKRMAEVESSMQKTTTATQQFDKTLEKTGETGDSSAKMVISGFNLVFASVTAGMGAMQAFGGQSEELTKNIAKMQGMMALLSATTQLQNDLTTKGTAAYTIYTTAVGTSTGAMKLFRLALLATGLGAIVVVIGAVVANWDKISNAVDKSTGYLKIFKDIINTVQGAFKTFSDNLGDIVIRLVKNFSIIPRLFYTLSTEGVSGAIDFIKNEIDDNLKLGKKIVAETTENSKKIGEEKERLSKIDEKIANKNKQILQAEAKGLDSTRLQIELKTLELSKLTKGSDDYLRKQAEIVQLQKSLDKTTKTTTTTTKEKVEELTKLQELEKELLAIQKEANDTSVVPGSEKAIDIKKRADAKQQEIDAEIKRRDDIFKSEEKLTYIQKIRADLQKDQAKLEAMNIEDMNSSNAEYVLLTTRILENKEKEAEFQKNIKDATEATVKVEETRVQKLTRLIAEAQEKIDKAGTGVDITPWLRDIYEYNKELNDIKKNIDDISQKLDYIGGGEPPVFNTNKKWKEQLEEIKKYYEDIARLQGGTLTDNQQTDQKNAIRDGRMEKSGNILGAIDQSFGALGSLSDSVMEARLNKFDEQAQKEQIALENALKNSYITQEQYEKKKLELEKKTAIARTALLKKQFAQNKAFQLSSAISAGALAVLQALKSPPGPPFSYITAAATGVIALANINKIASTKFQGDTGGATEGASLPTAQMAMPNFQTGQLNFNPNVSQIRSQAVDAQRVYVLESDITSTQRNVQVIENNNRYN